MNRTRAVETLALVDAAALVAARPVNLAYLAEYSPEAPIVDDVLVGAVAVYLPGSGTDPVTLFIGAEEAAELSLSSPSWMPQVVVVPEVVGHALPDELIDPLTAAVARHLAEAGLVREGIVTDDPFLAGALEASLPRARVIADADVFRHVRAVKTDVELDLMIRSTRILEEAFHEVVDHVAPGVTCGELMRIFREAMVDRSAFGSHMTYGGASRPYVGCSDFDYRLRDGDVLFIDPAGSYRQYWSDTGRTVVVGAPPTRFQRLYDVLDRVHQEVVPRLQPGTRFSDVTAAAIDIAADALPRGFMPILHSIGLEQYDHRRGLGLGPNVLEEGMIVNFETLYFELGLGTLQLEDTFRIREGAPLRLTTLDRAPVWVHQPLS